MACRVDFSEKTYNEAKENAKFPALLKWAASKDDTFAEKYSDATKKDQFLRLQKLGRAAA